jgi:hypothetical protein
MCCWWCDEGTKGPQSHTSHQHLGATNPAQHKHTYVQTSRHAFKQDWPDFSYDFYALPLAAPQLLKQLLLLLLPPQKKSLAATACCCTVSTHFVEMYPAGTCVRE